MGKKYVSVMIGETHQRLYVEDVFKVYKRRAKKARKPIPTFEKSTKYARKDSQTS
jgi:hypothetical protein